MTKKIFYILLLFSPLSFSISAQYNFVIQNGKPTVFKTLSEAYTNASAGDTIYLPGGSFNFPGSVDKSLIWMGVGYHPDSTESTYYTRINNQAFFTGNCDNTQISGIHFASNLIIGSSGDDAVNVSISRCRILGSLQLKYNDGEQRDVNTLVSECVIDGNLDAYFGSNIIVEKCIVRGVFFRFRSSLIDRIILSNGARNTSWGKSYFFNDCQENLVMNSIFNYNTYSSYFLDYYNNANNNFLNNIFAGIVSFPAGTNTGTNNQTSVDLSTVFEHIETNLQDFSFLHDFHLKTDSPALGAGISGTDIGIFGGARAFKEGGLPVIPHIRSVNVDTETSNGILHIEIEASSQDK